MSNRVKYFTIFLLVITSIIYIIPLLVISVIAILLRLFGIYQDFTSINFVVWFITPITHLEQKLKN